MFRFPFSTGIRQVVQTGDATPKFLKNEQRSFAVNNPYALSVTSGSITGCLTSLYSISKLLLNCNTVFPPYLTTVSVHVHTTPRSILFLLLCIVLEYIVHTGQAENFA